MPTVGLESVFATAAVDARKNREVIMIEITGTFLHANNEDYVVMRMNRLLAELAKTNPTLYEKYITDEKERQSYTYTFKRHFMG